MNLILSVLSAILLLFAFPKFDLFFLAYFALVPLFMAIRRSRTLLSAASTGLLFGAVFMAAYLYWVTVLSKWAGFWANMGWVGLFAFQAFFFAVFAALYWSALRRYPRYMILIAPLAWVVIEWLRALGPYGVTGGDICYSQAAFLPLIQAARYATCYGVSFLAALFNEALTELVEEKRYYPIAVSTLVLVLALSFGIYRISSHNETGTLIKISVIQANVSQDVKLDFGLAFEIVSIHDSLSVKARSNKPDIIIWPETAVTTYLLQTKKMLESIKGLIRSSGSYYLIGTPYRDGEKIYNSVVAFAKDGSVIGRYDKQRLVPFGEYLPLRSIFYALLQENPLFAEDYSSNNRPEIIALGKVKVGTVICFESTFPYLVRDKVRRGAQFILVATNDAWFFDSAAVYQHIQAAQMRAVENNIYVVQAANTGISAIIDPLGRIVQRTRVGETAILTGDVFVH